MLSGRAHTLAGLVAALTVVPLPLPALAGTASAAADEPAPTTLAMGSPPAYAGTETPLTITLLAADGTPLPDARVVLARRRDGEWQRRAVLTTDPDGAASLDVTLTRDADDNVFRARFDGDEAYAAARTGPVAAPLRKRTSVVTITAPDSVVDERTVLVRVARRTGSGLPVPGPVELHRRLPGQDWQLFRRLRTGADGVAGVEVTPRVDTRWRAVGRAQDWVSGDASPVHLIDNLPSGVPVALPAGAPPPRIDLPAQPRASGTGANPRTTRIPDAVWRHMTGRSWHRGCPVGRPGLRLLRINYWGYDGYRYRGELVAHVGAVGAMRGALVEMYARKLPLRSLYRVDRFGWSRKLRGADDHRSMAAGNTSAFNCRDVVGRPGVRSPHSWGRSLDVNPWENPYLSSAGWVPNSWWVGRSHPRVAWRSRKHAVVALMARHGLRWTYGTRDAHHFDAPTASGRIVMARRCTTYVCH